MMKGDGAELLKNETVAGSNGGREASAGSLRTPRRVFEAIRVEEKAEVFVLEDD
jgi:hypothetical protein